MDLWEERERQRWEERRRSREEHLDRVRLQLESDDPDLDYLMIGNKWGDEEYGPRDDDWKRDGESIGKNTHLRKLILADNTDVAEEDIEAFWQGVASNRSIQELELFVSCDLYDGRVFPMLTPFFRNNTSLEHLDIVSCYLGADCLSLLVQALKEFDSLKHFGMAGCLTDEFIEYSKESGKFVKPKFTLSDVFRVLRGHSSLESLTLTETWHDFWIKEIVVGRSCWKALAALLQDPGSKISVLDLSENIIDDVGAAILAPALICVKEVNLEENYSITERGWRAILSAMQDPRCSLQKLSLRPLKDASALRLAGRANKTLRALDLHYNPQLFRSAEGRHELFQMLKSPHCLLETLDVSKSDLDDACIRGLTNALADNGTLRVLNIGRNDRVTPSGWEYFAAILRNPGSQLERLDLHWICLNGIALTALSSALVRNAKLKELLMSRNHTGPVPNFGWGVLSRMLCNRSTIMSTFHSNHTLQKLGWGQLNWVPVDVRQLLAFNRENSQKILQYHFRGSFFAEPFVDMELSLLPHALSWMGRDEVEINGRYFLFLRNMPMLFDGAKQKRA